MREKKKYHLKELPKTIHQPLKTNGKLHIAAAYDILGLKLQKLGIKVKLLHDTSIFARRQARLRDLGDKHP